VTDLSDYKKIGVVLNSLSAKSNRRLHMSL